MNSKEKIKISGSGTMGEFYSNSMAVHALRAIYIYIVNQFENPGLPPATSPPCTILAPIYVPPIRILLKAAQNKAMKNQPTNSPTHPKGPSDCASSVVYAINSHRLHSTWVPKRQWPRGLTAPSPFCHLSRPVWGSRFHFLS